MNTLTINDLAVTNELSRKNMRTVRGGHKADTYHMGAPSYPLLPMPSFTTSIDAKQDLRQAQQVVNETADGSAFISGVHVTNNTSQFGQNNLLVG
jgi:predicted transposase YdaD